MEATLYLPGQAPRPVTLTALTCEAAAPLMGLAPQLVDVLAGSLITDTAHGATLPDGFVVFACGDLDDNAPWNEKASDALSDLIGPCDVSGPVLVVQTVTVPQPAPEPDMSAIIAEFLAEVKIECQQAGAPLPTFVANHRPGDEKLYSGIRPE